MAVLKPIYIPATTDSTSCVNEDTAKRMISWISAISVEVKARQPYDVWSTGIMRHNLNGETYDSLMVFAAFENIKYADLVDMAAVFKRYEPDNLILDDGRYPALDAFIPTPELVSEVFRYATKIQAAKAKNPDLKSWKFDDNAPQRARHAAPEPAQTAPAATPSAHSAPSGDIEAWFS
ncbi:hypothetical protein H7J87_11765 [Mycolicibacterium wolinskyi]|uniref:hypothetical protein n=1 Tax=Mycolicibacterium TaxID=1866885 RepID=UPI001056114B|nr:MULTISPECIES: hypothetical protein [Mycolicibacterium]MCV7286007.1 hypothetical protein [Mycolicibacterium wolinskyi]MCV7296203.1 hypothetical protein [Mycolicibacterium goodii]